MDASDRESAERTRARIERGRHDPADFRAALLNVAPAARDAWVDSVFDLHDVPDDGPELPRGCVPYVPCPVSVLLRLVDEAGVSASDIFVDVGAGVGRAAAFVQLLTGAEVVAVEVQPGLVSAARALARRLRMSRLSCIEGDAVEVTVTAGTVFFLYCPFSGERLAKVLGDLEAIAKARTIRIGCVDLPLPACGWLERQAPGAGDLAIYRSVAR